MRLKLREDRKTHVSSMLNSSWLEWHFWLATSGEVTLKSWYHDYEKGDLWSVQSVPPLPAGLRLLERKGFTAVWISLEDFEPVEVLPQRPRNMTCSCGSHAFQIFRTVECENPSCVWYRP